MKRIGTKILIILLIVGLISVIPISLIGINSIFKLSKQQAKNFGEKSAYYNATIIKTWMDEKSKLLYNIKVDLRENSDFKALENSLHRYSEINEDFISLFVGFYNNTLVDAYGWQPDDAYEVIKRPWFVKASQSESTIVTSTYQDWNKNQKVVAMATSITINNKHGVLATNVYADYLESIIKDIKYGRDGIVYLLDDKNQIMIDSKDMENTTLFQSIMDQIPRSYFVLSADASYEIEVDDISYITSLAKIDGYDWTLILIAPTGDFTEPARVMINQYIVIILVLILILFYIDYKLSKIISRPINSLIKSISKIAQGDFSSEVKLKGNDEITNVGKELDKMRRNLKQIFESNEYESKILAMNSKNLEAHLSETYQGTYNFMSLLSHDIKTPITLIKGYSKAMIMDIVDEKKKDMYIERIAYRADQIEQIATDILDDTADVNNLSIKLTHLAICDYINMLIYNSEIYVKNQKREFLINIDYSSFHELEFIKIDVIKIQRVINNILSNAVKFSATDSIIELTVIKKETKLLTYFKDSGSGVDRDDKEKIFNMFCKLDENKKGYGLGLYISKAIIKAHKGEIHFESSLGQWTESGYSLHINNSID